MCGHTRRDIIKNKVIQGKMRVALMEDKMTEAREIRNDETMPPKLGKPEKADALKQLGTHVALFGVWVAVIRITPYILNYFSDQKEEPSGPRGGQDDGSKAEIVLSCEKEVCGGANKEIQTHDVRLLHIFYCTTLAALLLTHAWALPSSVINVLHSWKFSIRFSGGRNVWKEGASVVYASVDPLL
ncbi:hypothetical protein H5410_052281 [Solanum commersonii]|uniref:Uncharacterized protein n=1 Tax=Solanum commersonii TaxID=4109 RepID=A0A9J5X359_SOLCO|nr:hypothetical protein H5410_052281 [Solanum commersonii]